MAAIKFKSTLGVERMYAEGFGGIDRTEADGTCHLAENLDTDADGSLKTRAGYNAVAEYEGSLRASFNFAGKLYTVIDSLLVVTDTESGRSEVKANLEKSEGNADIFCFGGEIYIHDGASFFLFKDEVLTRVEGYAPLYGKDWYPTARGPINEDINLLSDRIRISYSIGGSVSEFYLGIKAASIDRVEINGRESTISAHLDEQYPSIIHTNALTGDMIVTFWLTLTPESSQMHRIMQTTRAFVFGNNGGERLCLYNPGVSCNLYSSRSVSEYEQTLSALTAPESLPLYVPASSALCIGSGAYPITDLAHHYGRGILFTENDAWLIDWDGSENDSNVEKPQCFLLNSAIGADHIRSSAYFDNDPITYFCGKLWRWHSKSGVHDECSASVISDPVADLIPQDSEKTSMLSLPQQQKIFISDADDEEGKLLVYDLARNAWSIWNGIFAERLFRYGNLPAFSRGGNIYVFQDSLEEDHDSDEKFEIISVVSTHYLDFGCPKKTKRSAAVLIECALSGGKGKLIFENEKGEKSVFILQGKPDGSKELFSEHFRLPRFQKLRLTLETSAPAVIYSAIISAK